MLMAALAVSPGIASFIETYGVSESTAMLSITLPYLVSIPFTLLASRLSRRFSKKSLILFGIGIIFLTGVIPFFLSEFFYILLVRSLMGIGLGILFTITPSLAPDYYPEGRMRSLTVGMQSAWAGSGGFVFNILSGYLASGQTRDIYLVYGVCILAFLAVLRLLPQIPAAPPEPHKKAPFDRGSLKTGALTFLFIGAGMTLSLNIAVYVTGAGIGGAVQAGYATSAYSIAAFVTGCCYAFVARLLKEQALMTACLLSFLGMLLCVALNQMACTYVGAALVGAGLSIFMPSCVNRMIRTTRREAIPVSIGIMMVGSSVGQTFSSLLINPIAALFSNRVEARFFVSAMLFALVWLLNVTNLPKQTGAVSTPCSDNE